MPPPATAYPVTLSVDYPEHKRNRLTAFFRLFTVIPIAIVSALLTGFNANWNDRRWGSATWSGGDGWHYTYSTMGVLFLATLVMILFRQKYPKWWFDWNLALTRFGTRVGSYFVLLRDEYPSTDEEQAVHLDLRYPDVKKELNRWLPLVKWLLAIPHYVVLAFLVIAAVFATIFAWFAIVFAGSHPRSLFDFVVGVGRWAIRVGAYAFLLTTDRYPPFSLS
ncbi:MAG: DUF4389 domain-containing protein [Chloroflexi bacterium]|nr:DUF4389 domain-containing protein [Chloroflexota bacterium]